MQKVKGKNIEINNWQDIKQLQYAPPDMFSTQKCHDILSNIRESRASNKKITCIRGYCKQCFDH